MRHMLPYYPSIIIGIIYVCEFIYYISQYHIEHVLEPGFVHNVSQPAQNNHNLLSLYKIIFVMYSQNGSGRHVDIYS